ncbi:MAG: hypothetical protein ACM3VV_01130 [Deltaproteobacteria bacterium]|jgi:hypothetical protein
MNPTNTVIVDVNTLLGEYTAYNSAMPALVKNPKIPAIRAYPKSSLEYLSLWYNRFIRQS